MRKTVLFVAGFAAATCAMIATSDAAEITDWLSAKGDIRNRFEYIDEDGKDTRQRFRLRARLELKAESTEELDVIFRFASGSDDPVSSNTTFDNGFSTKDLRLDRAYVSYHPTAVEGLDAKFGKMKQPWVVIKGLVWDSDLNPEGFALNQSIGGEGMELDLLAGGFVVEERSSDDDTYLAAAQAAVTMDVSETVSVLAGASLFAFINMEDYETVYESDDSFGNDTVPVLDDEGEETGDLLYDNDFTEVEGFLKVKLDVGIPVAVYGDYVVNTEADDEDTGVMGGVTLGKAKEPGSWQFDANYRDLEANAVVGAFTDSDSGGGGTDVEGVKLQGKYQLSKNWQFVASWFINEIDDGDTDYNRGQFDLIAKF